MKFDFLSLWELTLQEDLDDEGIKMLIPTKRGKLEHCFEKPPLNMQGKNLIMLMGVPGSGKSTMAEELNKYCADIGLSSKVISLDNIVSDFLTQNIQIINFDVNTDNLQINCLQNEFNESADLYDVIILDGTFLSISERFVVLKTVSEYFSNIVGLFLDTNLDTLQKVQAERFFKRLTDEEFEYYQDLAKQTLQNEQALTVGFDTVYIIQR